MATAYWPFDFTTNPNRLTSASELQGMTAKDAFNIGGTKLLQEFYENTTRAAHTTSSDQDERWKAIIRARNPGVEVEAFPFGTTESEALARAGANPLLVQRARFEIESREEAALKRMQETTVGKILNPDAYRNAYSMESRPAHRSPWVLPFRRQLWLSVFHPKEWQALLEKHIEYIEKSEVFEQSRNPWEFSPIVRWVYKHFMKDEWIMILREHTSYLNSTLEL